MRFFVLSVLSIVCLMLFVSESSAQCGSQQVSSFNLNASQQATAPVQNVGLFSRLRGGGGCSSGGCGQSSQSSIRVERNVQVAAPAPPQNQSMLRRLEIRESGGCASGQCDQSSNIQAQTADKLAEALDSIGDALKDVQKQLADKEESTTRNREFQLEFSNVGWAPQYQRSYQMEYNYSGNGYGAASRAAFYGAPYRQKATPVRDALETRRNVRAEIQAQRAEQKAINALTAPVYGY